MVLVLISMAGFAAFLLSDILSFGLNSDHQTFLAGLEHQDSIDNILSMINWSEMGIEPGARENPVAQKRRFNDPLEANSSPGKGDIVRVAANISGDGNSSPSRAVNSSHNATELNLSNSSRMANSLSSNMVSSGSTIRSTSGGASSSKTVNDKKAPLIKMNHGSSSGTPTSQSSKPKDLQGDQKNANKPQSNATQQNATQQNATQQNATQQNATQQNATQQNATQVNNIQTNNTSIKQLQIEEVSTTGLPVYGISISQLQAGPASTKDPLIGQTQTNGGEIDSSLQNSSLNKLETGEVRTGEDSVLEQSANDEIERASILPEKENRIAASGNSPANPATAPIATAQNFADKANLPIDTADSRSDPAKDASVEMPPLEIEFKADSTASPGSENSPGGENTNIGTVPNANPASNPVAPESSPVAETKDTENDVSPISKDSTSKSESSALGGGSASVKKPGATVASKSEKLQEIRYQKIANRNQAIENSKKRAARSRG